MFAVKELVENHEEEVFCTIKVSTVCENLSFIGYVEANVGILCIGEKLKIEFKWTIETELLLERMKEATSLFDVLDLIEEVRQHDLYA